jgi:nucleoside-diphosphate-sugar epimerase
LSKSIGILGCGWLGLPLGEHLSSLGFRVKGSTTSEEKLNTLRSKSIEPFILQVTEEGIVGKFDFFNSVDKLIIAMPPGLRSNPKRRFDVMMNHVKKACVKEGIKEVIFISSTSVYGNLHGIITEKSNTEPETNSGKQLLQCEKLLSDSIHFNTTILRMGGLIGADRHPVFQLSKKEFVTNPKGSINLIHLTDCINIIGSLINQIIVKNVYNCVTPYHPNRVKYYTQMAIKMDCNPPKFRDSITFDRKISSKKLQEKFNYAFRVINLLISS